MLNQFEFKIKNQNVSIKFEFLPSGSRRGRFWLSATTRFKWRTNRRIDSKTILVIIRTVVLLTIRINAAAKSILELVGRWWTITNADALETDVPAVKLIKYAPRYRWERKSYRIRLHFLRRWRSRRRLGWIRIQWRLRWRIKQHGLRKHWRRLGWHVRRNRARNRSTTSSKWWNLINEKPIWQYLEWFWAKKVRVIKYDKS